jgi:hypothetical protein
MEIRFLTADDAIAWSSLRLESLKRDPEAFSSSVEEHYTLSLEEIQRRLGSGWRDRSWERSSIGYAGFQEWNRS